MRVSALVVARNEEARLPGCLAALAPADELVVVLDRSTDNSAQLARAGTCNAPFQRYALPSTAATTSPQRTSAAGSTVPTSAYAASRVRG